MAGPGSGATFDIEMGPGRDTGPGCELCSGHIVDIMGPRILREDIETVSDTYRTYTGQLAQVCTLKYRRNSSDIHYKYP